MLTAQELTALVRQWLDASTTRSMHDWMRFVRASGLSMQQFGIMMNLRHHPSCGITDISTRMDTTPAAASQLVDKLVQAGLVARSEDPSDRRAKEVTLTAKGHALIARGLQARALWVDDLVAALSPAEYEAVAAAVDTLTQAARRIETDRPDKNS